MTGHTRLRRLGRAPAAVGIVVLLSASVAAQTTPPIPGVTGAIAPEGSDGGAGAIGAVATKAVEGTRRLLRAVGIGGKDDEKRVDSLETLQVGMTVVVRYDAGLAAAPDASRVDAPLVTEGRVIERDRRNGVIVVRLADRRLETLQLAERSARDRTPDDRAPSDAGETVSVSYVDANGDRVLILFRKVP